MKTNHCLLISNKVSGTRLPVFMPCQLANYNTENQAAASRLIEAVESVGITTSLEIQAVSTALCIALKENTWLGFPACA